MLVRSDYVRVIVGAGVRSVRAMQVLASLLRPGQLCGAGTRSGCNCTRPPAAVPLPAPSRSPTSTADLVLPSLLPTGHPAHKLHSSPACPPSLPWCTTVTPPFPPLACRKTGPLWFTSALIAAGLVLFGGTIWMHYAGLDKEVEHIRSERQRLEATGGSSRRQELLQLVEEQRRQAALRKARGEGAAGGAAGSTEQQQGQQHQQGAVA